MSRPRLLFRHGWALDRTLWDAVLAALGAEAEDAVVTDAGYYGRPCSPSLPDGPLLGVGQSLGALELMAAPPPGLVGVVAIDGFARFARADGFPQGVPPRVLARMKARVADGALAEFLERAGGRPPEGRPDIERLVEGLERLEQMDGRAFPLPVWRLRAEADPIALPMAADASFEGLAVAALRILPSTDHLSPLSDPQACAALIREALEALSSESRA